MCNQLPHLRQVGPTIGQLQSRREVVEYCDGIAHYRNECRRYWQGTGPPPFHQVFIAWCGTDTRKSVRVMEFSTFDEKLQPTPFKFCKEWAMNFPSSGRTDEVYNLVLHGPHGTGKTHLARSIEDCLKRRNIKVEFVHARHVRKLIVESRASNTDWHEKDIAIGKLRQLKWADVLIIDDLGNEDEEPTSNYREELALFLDDRNTAGHRHVVTCNNPDMMEEKLGRTVCDRLFFRSTLVSFTGVSQRTGA